MLKLHWPNNKQNCVVHNRNNIDSLKCGPKLEGDY